MPSLRSSRAGGKNVLLLAHSDSRVASGSDLGAAACRNEYSDGTRPDRPPKSLVDRDGFALKGLALVR